MSKQSKHLCDTCQHQIGHTQNGCLIGNHEQGLVEKCEDYKTTSKQVGGDHYSKLGVQPWDAMESWLSRDQFIGFLLGSAIAYLGRFNATTQGKGGRQDIEKAKHYLEKLLEVTDER